jgi:hypothetical protein
LTKNDIHQETVKNNQTDQQVTLLVDLFSLYDTIVSIVEHKEKQMTQSTDPEFEDSLEATEFMEKLQEMLDDQRLKKWAKITDSNFGTQTADSLWHA